jgi:predicted DNA-binding transcriptional regulator YafY
MPNIIQTTKRQIEILSLIQEYPGKYSVIDLEDKLNIGKATVERDLQQLRSWGVAVHSVRGKLQLEQVIPERKFVELLSMYIAFSSSQSIFHKSLVLAFKRLKENTLSTFVKLNRAIENNLALKFTYTNVEANRLEKRSINPYGITLLGKRWLLLGYDDKAKQLRHYLIENISELELTDKKFKPDKDFDIAKYYENVWGRWHHEKMYNVKIWFDPKVTNVILNRYWHTNQKVRKQKDGSVIFEAKVSGLYEITNWILPWGKLARVIGPKELKDRVNKIALEILI